LESRPGNGIFQNFSTVWATMGEDESIRSGNRWILCLGIREK
jgi:hypothetical protein